VCDENGNEGKDKLRRAFRLEDRGNPAGDACSCATHVRFRDHLREKYDLESEGRLGSSVAFPSKSPDQCTHPYISVPSTLSNMRSQLFFLSVAQ
jgi:hypothetical protein